MSEAVVPLLDLPALGKTPPGKLPSKADFLCLLWGSVGGNFVGFQGKIYFNQTLLHSFASQELQVSAANTSLTTEQVKQLLESLLSDNCAMENLDFSANILSMIEPDLMAKSLNKLKVVTLLDSNISVNQVGKNIISCN